MKVQHNTDYNAIHSNTFKAQKAHVHQLEERGKSSYDKISDSVNIKHAEYGRSDNIIKTFNLPGNQQVYLIYSTSVNKITANIITKDGDVFAVKNENLPKEFEQIKSREVFNKFLESAYARVGILSNGDFKLYINQQGLGGGQGGSKSASNSHAYGPASDASYRGNINANSGPYSNKTCPIGYNYKQHPTSALVGPDMVGGKCEPNVNTIIRARGSGISAGDVHDVGMSYTQHSSGMQPNQPSSADDFRAAGYIWQNGQGGRDARPGGWVRIESSKISHGGPDGRHKP
jgi:hypothetical protein